MQPEYTTIKETEMRMRLRLKNENRIAKRIAGFVAAALTLVGLLSVPVGAYTAPDTVNHVSVSTTTELKNWQQSDDPWGSYVVHGGRNSVLQAGCGILATCNAVHYTTGYFLDPAALAEWANSTDSGYYGEGTEGSVFFYKFQEAFGRQLGFSFRTFHGIEGRQNLPKVRQTISDKNTKKLLIERDIRDGNAIIAHVENHYLAIMDYNSMTDKFLIWDNCAGDMYGGHRAGITHAAGDWFTWEELRGILANNAGEYNYFNVDFVVPVVRTRGRQMMNVSRDELTVGSTRLQKSGECCNFTPVNVKKVAGKELVFTGSYTSVSKIDAVGYRVNGNSTVYEAGFMTPASDSARDEGVKWCGEDSYTVGFEVSVPVSRRDTRFEVVVLEDGYERVIWTAESRSEAEAGTPIPIEAAEHTERTGILCDGVSIIGEQDPCDADMTVDFSDCIGKSVTLEGWYATNRADIEGFGLSIDGGEIDTDRVSVTPVPTGVYDCAAQEVGRPNHTAAFSARIDVDDFTAHTYSLYARSGGSDVLIWTVRKTATVMPTGTGDAGNVTDAATDYPDGEGNFPESDAGISDKNPVDKTAFLIAAGAVTAVGAVTVVLIARRRKKKKGGPG